MSRRPCLGSPATPRCPVLVSDGPRCDRCQASRDQVRNVRLDRQRGSASARGYTHQWAMASRRHLEQYPLCGQRAEHAYPDGWRGACHDQGKTTPAACTDHIRAPKGDPVQFWDPRNWQSLCSDCNRVKAIRYESGFGRTPQP